MTLCQYYDQEVKKIGYHSWNHYCAEVKGNGSLEWEKKQLKREWKLLYAKNVKNENKNNASELLAIEGE